MADGLRGDVAAGNLERDDMQALPTKVAKVLGVAVVPGAGLGCA